MKLSSLLAAAAATLTVAFAAPVIAQFEDELISREILFGNPN